MANLPGAGDPEVALHLSQPLATTAATATAADGGGASAGGREWWAALDASRGWRAAAAAAGVGGGGGSGSGSTAHEAAAALGCFRFFDCDMHYSRPTLARLVRALQRAAPQDREQVPVPAVGMLWRNTPPKQSAGPHRLRARDAIFTQLLYTLLRRGKKAHPVIKVSAGAAK
jgi:hypothetical protein